ncbi:MAG TPA: transglutaminaseTgpA domain-containing protein [Thermoanaerobaculia bacterium]|nr:transglutaminaseTgpA domain-containing protein [Thermoanaerobaculia bacterium]
MSFGRQKRVLLGLLALVAPLPLWLKDGVVWPVLLLYWLGVLLFLHRASLDTPGWLPEAAWALYSVCLAAFSFDLLLPGGSPFVLAVVHLCLFALLVKLFSLRQDADPWQAAAGIFFLFLASLGTSVSSQTPVLPLILYLLLFGALGLVLLTRFAFFYVLSGVGSEVEALAEVPIYGFLSLAFLAVLVVAFPICLILPPLFGHHVGIGAGIAVVGFSDAANLASTKVLQGNRAEALRVRGGASVHNAYELRFKASADDYKGGTWHKAERHRLLSHDRKGRFQLASAPPTHWVSIELQPLGRRSLPLPVETTVLELQGEDVAVDGNGAVELGRIPEGVLKYRAGLADQPILLDAAPGPESPDSSGITQNMTNLAKREMGQGSDAERAERLEAYLRRSYDYSLTERPLDDFLFRDRNGSCEDFAQAMVLLLQSQGIRAHRVRGFLGGEYESDDFVVRHNNTHAWVEAYLPGEGGWRTFDPTPPARPSLYGPRAVALYVVPLVLLGAVAFWLRRRRRTPLTATDAYHQLRRHLSLAGSSLPESTPPLAFKRAAAARFPEAALSTAKIVDLYLRESFDGKPLADEERKLLKKALGEAEREMRKAG